MVETALIGWPSSGKAEREEKKSEMSHVWQIPGISQEASRGPCIERSFSGQRGRIWHKRASLWPGIWLKLETTCESRGGTDAPYGDTEPGAPCGAHEHAESTMVSCRCSCSSVRSSLKSDITGNTQPFAGRTLNPSFFQEASKIVFSGGLLLRPPTQMEGCCQATPRWEL